jgi:arsenate reductase (thioredoxin)
MNILILCTHNSARSILSEALLNHWALRLGRDLRAFSAGSSSGGNVNPLAIEALQAAGVDTAGLRSKSWNEFASPGAPEMRVVITVCDNAAAEACPIWPGSPVKMHWGLPDPSTALGGDEGKQRAFHLTRDAIGYRVLQMLQLPLEKMTNGQLGAGLARIHTP